jgi:hypothetical protein
MRVNMTSSFCELFTQQPQSPPIHPRHQANEDERMSPPSKKKQQPILKPSCEKETECGRNFLILFSRTLSKLSPSRDTIEIEERQGTYTSERIVDEDGSRRTLKGGHGF